MKLASAAFSSHSGFTPVLQRDEACPEDSDRRKHLISAVPRFETVVIIQFQFQQQKPGLNQLVKTETFL